MSNDPTYDPDCRKCDLDIHYCGGCGELLRHNGKELDGTTHKECT